MSIAAASLLAAAIGALVAQIVAPDVQPSPAATATPGRVKPFASGPQFVTIGAAVSPRVQSEFRPGSTAGTTSFEGWQTSETTLFGRFHVLSFTDYRSFGYDHPASEPVAVIGGRGFATVPAFHVHDDELESGGGVRVAPHVFAGIAFFKRQETSGYPPLTGIGYALMLAPNPRPLVSPYAWFTYQPNAGGLYALPDGTHTALSYRGVRYRIGAIVREPGTRMFVDLGYAGENLFDRTNAPMRVTDGMPVIGIGVHF
jgi:hypothetical protein